MGGTGVISTGDADMEELHMGSLTRSINNGSHIILAGDNWADADSCPRRTWGEGRGRGEEEDQHDKTIYRLKKLVPHTLSTPGYTYFLE